jgi:ComF family protein
MTWLNEFRRLLIGFFYPQSCVLCRKWTVEPDGRPLCRYCTEALRGHWLPTCPCCGILVPGDLSDPANLCSHCRVETYPFDKAASWGPYEGALRRILWHYKFRGGRRLDAPLAELLLETFVAEFHDAGVTGLVPVPIHARRIRERGFDQTLALARKLSRMLGLPVEQPVRRVRNTRPLYGLDPVSRRRSLKGAFSLVPDARLTGCRYLVVDDILTTGTTAAELASLLKRGRCEWVGVLTVARTSVRYG